MRKSIFVALVAMVAALVMGALPAAADHSDDPSSRCTENGVLQPGGSPESEDSVSVCIEGLGATTAAIIDEGNGYVVVDGDDKNPLTDVSQCLDGHVAVQVVDGEPGIASGDGEFETTDEETGETTVHHASYEDTPQDPEAAPPTPEEIIASCTEEEPA